MGKEPVVLHWQGGRAPLKKQGQLAVETLQEEPFKVIQISDSDASWTPHCGGIPGTFNWRDPRIRWRDYKSHLPWERHRIPLEELEDVARRKDIWATLLSLAEDWSKMDGCSHQSNC